MISFVVCGSQGTCENMFNTHVHGCINSIQLSTVRWRDEQSVPTPTMGYPTGGNADPRSSKNEPWRHYAKWNKPNTKDKHCVILSSLEYSIQRQKVEWCCQGLSRGWNTKFLSGYRVSSFAQWESTGYTAMWTHLPPPNSTLSNG